MTTQTQTFDLYTKAGIALPSDADGYLHSMAFDLNGGYPHLAVDKASIPADYDTYRFGNFYHLDVRHQNWKQR